MGMSDPDLAQLANFAKRADASARPLELAIVLPTFNERGNLASLVQRLDKALTGISWEVIFVDDDSPDGTSDEARSISRYDHRVRVIHRIGRRGPAATAIEGMMGTSARSSR